MGERLVAAHHVTPGAPSSPRHGLGNHGHHGAAQAQAGGERGPTPAQRAEVLACLRELNLVAV